jgi:hypothetical protein
VMVGGRYFPAGNVSKQQVTLPRRDATVGRCLFSLLGAQLSLSDPHQRNMSLCLTAFFNNIDVIVSIFHFLLNSSSFPSSSLSVLSSPLFSPFVLFVLFHLLTVIFRLLIVFFIACSFFECPRPSLSVQQRGNPGPVRI